MISIIIPTLNEEANINNLLSDLRHCDSLEVVVVDGGSTDRTCEIVNGYDVILKSAERGRAKQMNRGAEIASGDTLIFLHADTRIDEENLSKLTQLDFNESAGCFKMLFDRQSLWLRFFSKVAHLNCSFLTYGDQGLVINRSLFDDLGGFYEMPIMEDVDLIRRIRRRCSFKKYDIYITTSARRFEKYGIVRQQLRNIAIVTGYYLGINPEFLSRYYRY